VPADEAAWRELVARYNMPAGDDAAADPWPDRENLTERPLRRGADSAAETDGRGELAGPSHGTDTRPGRVARPAGPASGPDWTRVIRPASPPSGSDPGPDHAASSAPVAPNDDEHYIPPPPPPLPHLDPIDKGAWAALFGGPAYLVLTSLIGWTVPGWAALLAVMAFVIGFTVVVLRLGDRPPRGEGPDNGAVL
jgi:hypothetical protein